jgi:hypothetical protein
VGSTAGVFAIRNVGKRLTELQRLGRRIHRKIRRTGRNNHRKIEKIRKDKQHLQIQGSPLVCLLIFLTFL